MGIEFEEGFRCKIIDSKDVPILAVAVSSKVNRLLTLNTKDFATDVSIQSGMSIQTPGEFIQEIRRLLTKELS